MPLSRTKLVGLIFLCVGIGVYGSWVLWLATRTERPVNIPISMAVGHVRTREFKLNMSAPYTIEVEVQKKIPFDTLNCLLGMTMAPRSTALQECPDRPSNPRLKVEVHPEVYEGNMVWSAILFLAMGVMVLVGAILLVVSFIKNRRGRSSIINA